MSLVSIRKKKGWSQNLAASRSGMAQSSYSLIERGLGRPSDAALKKMANGLGLSLAAVRRKFREAQRSGAR